MVLEFRRWFCDIECAESKLHSCTTRNKNDQTLDKTKPRCGCVSDTMQKTVIVNPLPAADFAAIQSCQNRTISFTDASAQTMGNLTTWAWDFSSHRQWSSASASSLQEPSTWLRNPQVYTNVKLIVTEQQGCVNHWLFSEAGNHRSTPGCWLYIVPEVCLNDTYAQFTDTSYIAAGSITAWQWNFGDANSTVANPQYIALQNPPHS